MHYLLIQEYNQSDTSSTSQLITQLNKNKGLWLSDVC